MRATEESYYLAMWTARQIIGVRSHKKFFHDLMLPEDTKDLSGLESLLLEMLGRYEGQIRKSSLPMKEINSYLTAIKSVLEQKS